MPYILKENRDKFKDALIKLSDNIECDGDLNYVITTLLHKELLKRGINYQNMNNLVGAIECAKNEFSRVVMGPYEDMKRSINGPVSSLDEFKK